MSDAKALLQRLGRVGGRIAPELTDRDVERLVEGALRRRRRRRFARIAIATASLAVCAAFAVAHPRGVASHSAPQGVALPSDAPAAQALRLVDGSVATQLDPGCVLNVIEDSRERVALELARGRARFEVVSRPERPFSIRAGEVTISVVGTTFTVERVADRVGVSVERGTVQVDWGTGREEVRDGGSGWYPPLMIRSSPSAPSDVRPPPQKLRSATTSELPPETVAPESAEALLGAADRARLGGRAAEGAALLRRLLAEHRGDPRAPLAAFTLGRVLLMELGQPRQAAAAFAQARALSPGGSFAEDALAREVEAWKRAGDPALARSRAQEYVRRYPRGLRADAVKAFGGIE